MAVNYVRYLGVILVDRFFYFCLIKALSVYSDYYRAMELRVGGIDSGPGEMGVARVNPNQSSQGEPSVHNACFALRFPGPPTTGGGSGSATYPVDDVHQARITEDVWGWGGIWERTQRGIGCRLLSCVFVCFLLD